jgi:Mn2+/Fe2+ NRAMP family transporter
MSQAHSKLVRRLGVAIIIVVGVAMATQYIRSRHSEWCIERNTQDSAKHSTTVMGFKSLIVSSLYAIGCGAIPAPNPIQAIQAAGPAAGVVLTKCSSPGMLALAYDDGPYQYTQKLADILTAGGAKGTFFVTGTLYGELSHSPQVSTAPTDVNK